MVTKINTKKIQKKYIILIALTIIFIAGGFLTFNYLRQDTSDTNPNSTSQQTGNQMPTQNSGDTNVPDNPAQQKEKEPGSDERTQPTPSTSGKKKVTPVITSWGEVGQKFQVASRVPGVLEDGGICVLTMSKDGKSLTGSKTGVNNVSEVSCGYISIDRSKLSSGNWNATVSYSSKNAEGTSKPIVIKVN